MASTDIYEIVVYFQTGNIFIATQFDPVRVLPLWFCTSHN